jgi:hypothetical protein
MEIKLESIFFALRLLFLKEIHFLYCKCDGMVIRAGPDGVAKRRVLDSNPGVMLLLKMFQYVHTGWCEC